jgi:hypothetical protein
METKMHTSLTDTSTNVFLTGTILLANMDYTELFDYAIKAIIGGVIWMGFKLGGEYLGEKFKKNKK